jgi:hypothetical protein
MQDLGYELPRVPIPRTSVNKDEIWRELGPPAVSGPMGLGLCKIPKVRQLPFDSPPVHRSRYNAREGVDKRRRAQVDEMDAFLTTFR